MSRSRAMAVFRSGDPVKIADAIVRVSLHDPDREWVERQCLRFLRHEDADVRGAAATCLGHVARIHRTVGEAVVPALEALRSDAAVGARAGDALDDIRHFTAVTRTRDTKE
jgi:hypothetical protein